LLQPGDLAPDFDTPLLIGGIKKQFRLSDHRGKENLVLAFYPVNWERISAQQMVAYQVEREKFVQRQAEIVTISVDHIMSTTSWEREIGPFDFLMCSDFWPHGKVSSLYGVLREADPLAGASDRAIFVVNKAGKIIFSRAYALDELPDMNETLDILPRP